MNLSRFHAVILLVLIITMLLASPRTGYAVSAINPSNIIIEQWEIQWFKSQDTDGSDHVPVDSSSWQSTSVNEHTIAIPQGFDGAWIHIAVPPTADWRDPGLLVSHMYGRDISVYEEDTLIFQSTRDFTFDRNRLLIALESDPEPTNLYVRIESLDRAGFVSAIRVGDYHELSEAFVRNEIPSLLLSASIAFVSLMMFLISGYLNRGQRGAWIALSLIAITTSIMIATYSTLPFIYFEEIGGTFELLFDISMLVLFPALHYYVAYILGSELAFFRRFGRWFIIYSAFCLLVLWIYHIIGDAFFFYYKLFTFWLLAPFILVHLLLVIGQSIIHSIRGNKNSIILGIGFLCFAVMGIAEVFKTSENIYLWQAGIVALICSFVIVLARRISADHRKLLSYSKELELFNHRLQRTEKLKFVSDLAASIAHEVRNPLQVTRGFLQLISSKSDDASKPLFSIAISELDRASTIITDFLTFAKPELDTVDVLEIQQEMTQIESIISPMAAYHGAQLRISIPSKLYVQGNSSKFKQAFMNMIKNSIEALGKDGVVEIEAYAEQESVIVRIKDNGEGMEPEQIAKLGEPYFSTKTKGTGLGLMVTFRIIEIMKGTIEFHSEKGKGTEAIIRFPRVQLAEQAQA